MDIVAESKKFFAELAGGSGDSSAQPGERKFAFTRVTVETTTFIAEGAKKPTRSVTVTTTLQNEFDAQGRVVRTSTEKKTK